MMQGGFAFSKKDYKTAGALQEQSIQKAEESEEPQEIALAHYNLGNTRFAEERFTDAEECFTIAANVALDNKLHQMSAMSFTNLGITVHRLKRIPEAIDFFKVARDTFKALKQPPGEAYALDCLARMCKEEKGYDRAEEYWLEAYKVYDSITGKPMAKMRVSGCEDVLNKLEEMYRESGQRGKIPQVKQLRERLNNG
jgi:tetratricopeptide (TPR) repeat protein